MARRRVTRRRTRRRTYRGRRRRVVYGHGAYRTRRSTRRAPAKRRRTASSRSKKSLVGTLFDLGDMVSDYVPGIYGTIAKGGLKAARAITGHGDYAINSNSLMDAMTSNGPPRIVNPGSHGGFRISHREYLGDIQSGAGTPTSFALQAFALNPGMQGTFPWLSIIAKNFEQYQWHGIIFQYKTLSVDAINSTTINLGSVIMATDYNATHPEFTTKQQMENYEFCSSGKPSLDIFHPIECAPGQTPVDKLYIRSSTVPPGTDIRLYDLGNFQIATQGLPAQANSIGELWVSYDVSFFKPNVPFQSGDNPFDNSGIIHWTAGASSAWTTWNTVGGFNATLGTGAYGNRATSSPLIDSQYNLPPPWYGSDMTYTSSGTSSTTFNGGVVTGPQFAPGDVGIAYDASGTTGSGVNKLYFMLDSVPHAYKVDLIMSSTGTPTAYSADIVVNSFGATTTGIPIYTNYGANFSQAPASSVASLYSTFSYTVSIPTIGNGGGKNASALQFVSAWPTVVPATLDIFVTRIY